jgi:hypothetical protein
LIKTGNIRLQLRHDFAAGAHPSTDVQRESPFFPPLAAARVREE